SVRYILEHLLCNEFWCCRAGNQDRADDQIRLRNCVMNHVSAGGEGRDLRQKDIVKLAQSIEIVVDYRDVSTHTDGDLCSVSTYDTAADDHHARSWNSRNATKKNAATTTHFLQVVRAHLNRHASGNF